MACAVELDPDVSIISLYPSGRMAFQTVSCGAERRGLVSSPEAQSRVEPRGKVGWWAKLCLKNRSFARWRLSERDFAPRRGFVLKTIAGLGRARLGSSETVNCFSFSLFRFRRTWHGDDFRFCLRTAR
jgi:hypothetical protein